MLKWDKRYMDMVDLVASWSKDPDTKVGCVIVGEAGQILATGYNGFPRGVNDNFKARYERPEKYLWTEHAERNAIYNAARSSISLIGSTLYVGLHPCADCAKGIIQSGIKYVIIGDDHTPAQWQESFHVAAVMFDEVGMRVRTA